jgi:hypothetical protein
MSDLKRLEVKYIRDGAKSAYTKDKECYICGTDAELQLHHFNTINILWENWKRKNKITIDSVERIMEVRDTFVSDHLQEMYDEVVTLCKLHHMDRLHKIYGKVPPLYTAKKQKLWCDKRREKEYKV